jgi:hypothetical protein
MSDKRTKFFPFHAINEFMLPDYRQEVLQAVLENLDTLPAERRTALIGLVNKHVRVAGFRTSSLAPLPMKLKELTRSFERRADLAAQVLMAWSELHLDLRQQVFDMLQERKWELQSVDFDRTTQPGFMITWPKTETYEVLDAAYTEKYGAPTSENDVRLMIVWLTGRLPYEMVE